MQALPILHQQSPLPHCQDVSIRIISYKYSLQVWTAGCNAEIIMINKQIGVNKDWTKIDLSKPFFLIKILKTLLWIN